MGPIEIEASTNKRVLSDPPSERYQDGHQSYLFEPAETITILSVMNGWLCTVDELGIVAEYIIVDGASIMTDSQYLVGSVHQVTHYPNKGTYGTIKVYTLE